MVKIIACFGRKTYQNQLFSEFWNKLSDVV